MAVPASKKLARARRALSLIALSAATVALIGCYSEPLSTEPDALIDPRILGEWDCAVHYEKNIITMEVSGLGLGHYLVRMTGHSEGDRDMPMHLTAYGRVRIANVDHDPADAEHRWWLLRSVLVDDGLLQLQYVGIAMRLESPQDLREALKKNPEDPRLYDTFGACVRHVRHK